MYQLLTAIVKIEEIYFNKFYRHLLVSTGTYQLLTALAKIEKI